MNLLDRMMDKIDLKSTTFESFVIALGKTLIEDFLEDSDLWGFDKAIVTKMLESKAMCYKVAHAYFDYLEEGNSEVAFNVVEQFYAKKAKQI